MLDINNLNETNENDLLQEGPSFAFTPEFFSKYRKILDDNLNQIGYRLAKAGSRDLDLDSEDGSRRTIYINMEADIISFLIKDQMFEIVINTKKAHKEEAVLEYIKKEVHALMKDFEAEVWDEYGVKLAKGSGGYSIEKGVIKNKISSYIGDRVKVHSFIQGFLMGVKMSTLVFDGHAVVDTFYSKGLSERTINMIKNGTFAVNPGDVFYGVKLPPSAGIKNSKNKVMGVWSGERPVLVLAVQKESAKAIVLPLSTAMDGLLKGGEDTETIFTMNGVNSYAVKESLIVEYAVLATGIKKHRISQEIVDKLYEESLKKFTTVVDEKSLGAEVVYEDADNAEIRLTDVFKIGKSEEYTDKYLRFIAKFLPSNRESDEGENFKRKLDNAYFVCEIKDNKKKMNNYSCEKFVQVVVKIDEGGRKGKEICRFKLFDNQVIVPISDKKERCARTASRVHMRIMSKFGGNEKFPARFFREQALIFKGMSEKDPGGIDKYVGLFIAKMSNLGLCFCSMEYKSFEIDFVKEFFEDGCGELNIDKLQDCYYYLFKKNGMDCINKDNPPIEGRS